MVKELKGVKFSVFSNKLYVWYTGLSADLLFFVAINTLFFTTAKGLAFSDVMAIEAIAAGAFVLLYIPMLMFIKAIGNTKSSRLASALNIVAVTLFIVGDGFVGMMLGSIVQSLAFLLKIVNPIILKNNLLLEGKPHLFVPMGSVSKFVYSSVAAVACLTAGVLFDINPYLPMWLCLGITVCAFAMSMLFVDESERGGNKKNFARVVLTHKFDFKKLSKTLLFVVIFYGIMAAFVVTGQEMGKILLQNIKLTATVITVMLFVSRVARSLSCLWYMRMYRRAKRQLTFVLPIILTLGVVLMALGGLINTELWIRMIVITVGLSLVSMVRDPLYIFIQTSILEHSKREHRLLALSLKEVLYRVAYLIFAAVSALLLTGVSPAITTLCFVLLSTIGVVVGVMLYRSLLAHEKEQESTL